MKSMFTRIALALAVSLPLSALAQTQTPQSTGTAPGGGTTTSNPAPSPTGPMPTRIGIIEMSTVIGNINDGKRQFDALRKKYEPKDAELRKAATEVETLQNQYKTQGPKMNDDARTQLARTIEQKQRELQHNSDTAKAEYQTDLNDVVSGILKKLGPMIDKYAKDNGFAVIFDVAPIDGNQQVSPVLWGAEQVNITQSIIDSYNAQAGGAPPPSSTTAPRPRPSAGTTGTTPRTNTTAPPKPQTPPQTKPQQ